MLLGWLAAGLLVLAGASDGAAAKPEITSTRLPGGGYQLTLKAPDAIEPAAGIALMLSEAQRLCGGEPAALGQYVFGVQRSEKPDGSIEQAVKVVQDVTCGAAPPGPAATTKAGDWTPTEADARFVRGLTERYFAARQGGDYRAAWDMMSDEMKAISPFEAWREQTRAFHEGAGKLVRRRLVKLSWYDHPPSAPVPGVYAAVDYAAEYAKVSTNCGYVVWFREADGGWRLVRQEDSSIDRESQRQMDPVALRAFKQQYRCGDADDA